MALLQSLTILSVNGQLAGTTVLGFPTVTPTVASPCPVVGLLSSQIQGVSALTNAAFPAATSQLSYTYFNKGQRITTGVYVKEAVSAIIAAS